MSEGFKITGPGTYRQRNGEIRTVKPETGYPNSDYKWTDGSLLWADDGKYYVRFTDPRDLVARVDEPQPDVQDGVRGVIPPMDPLARLEVWARSKAGEAEQMRYFDISREFARLRFVDVTITVVGDNAAEAIAKALDIADGIR